jgi:hypothetical protein
LFTVTVLNSQEAIHFNNQDSGINTELQSGCVPTRTNKNNKTNNKQTKQKQCKLLDNNNPFHQN